MNNIYKVIWSKARNCYVVASEIAKSHTKSASGQSVRRSALASLLALSFLCGGLGVASAAETVKVDASTAPGAVEVYTKDGVDQALTHFDTKPEVDNKIDAKIGALTTTGDVATNKDNITELQRKTQKIDYDAANETTSINGMKVGQQVDMGGKNLTNVGTINGIALGEKESGDFISQDGSIWGNMKNVDTQVGKNFVAIAENKAAITALDTKVGTVGTGDYLDPTKSVGENLGRLDAGLKQEVADRTAADTALSDRIGTVADDGNYIKKSATNNVSENLKVLDTEIAKTNDRTEGITRNADDTQTTIEGKVTVDKDGNVGGVKDLTVDGKLNVGEIYLEHKKLESTGKDYDSATSIKADGISNRAKVTDENGNTTESKFTHNEKGTFNYAKDGDSTDWTETRSDVTANGVKTEAKDSKGNRTNTSQTASENKTYLEDKDGKNTNSTIDTAKGYDKIIKGENGQTSTKQDELNITNTAEQGTITNDAKNIVNNASGNMTNTVGGDLKTTVSGNELHEVTGTKTENVTGKVTENYGNGQETNVTGDQYIHVTGKQTNKIDGDQENIIGGNQTTIVTGDISNKAENITNEANTKLTDKVGDHTRVLDSDGITDTVGGSTFKQRIDAIMMESKDVSIKAKETLTNEAKVITNKASEVINNEAVNINNTATGIITSKASEIKNQADKLISNKVGENTWENMENGKITTSIKDGAKQNLTQSDAAGTTQSTVDGGKSTVTIQNADGLADAVTDGRNTSVQNQTASAIAADVKDGAGNENASVATATTSANTIKSGSKANTVISTADGTSFINSEAAAPVGDGTEVKTTIKGNTITTGKVTMDYAEVMKDLGVGGNAKIDGKTTTGSLEVTGTSTLKGDVTMESNATVKKDLTVGGNATIAGDVTARSYKVDGKTYISAAGINANDQKITNVADGSISVGSKDAVNGGQLYGVKRDLEHQVDKVGANAAAMANLRPMEFDPSSKWNIAAAIGNYGSETAAAIGAFYRPNDNVMVNLSTAFGTGENMVGGGVSVRLGKGGNKLSREETNALKAQVADLTARMDALLSVLNPNMSKDFPDVPENHWAYEAVSRLAGNDIVQGYPDGEFHGERTMTRYEMAEIIYNALSRGAEAERKLVEEFKPELQAMAASKKSTAEKAEG